MVTVGLVKEILFISEYFKSPIETEIKGFTNSFIKLRIENRILDIWYENNHIWHELIDGELSFFGIESCDSIARCISCLDNKDLNWKKYIYVDSKVNS